MRYYYAEGSRGVNEIDPKYSTSKEDDRGTAMDCVVDMKLINKRQPRGKGKNRKPTDKKKAMTPADDEAAVEDEESDDSSSSE